MAYDVPLIDKECRSTCSGTRNCTHYNWTPGVNFTNNLFIAFMCVDPKSVKIQSCRQFCCAYFNMIFSLDILSWLKSTLLMKNKCFDKAIYMKTQCLHTNETQHYCRKENAWEPRRGRERVALIKSLITQDRKDMLEARFVKDWAEFVSWCLWDLLCT